MLAHCWELEDRPDVAWQIYGYSVDLYPTNNICMGASDSTLQKILSAKNIKR